MFSTIDAVQDLLKFGPFHQYVRQQNVAIISINMLFNGEI